MLGGGFPNFFRWRTRPIARKLGITDQLVTFQVMRPDAGNGHAAAWDGQGHPGHVAAREHQDYGYSLRSTIEERSDAKYPVIDKASEGEYALSLYYGPDIGDAGFAALFAAQANPGYEPQELPNVRKVELSEGIVGYFRPVSCGASCAPANLWWKEDRVVYQIQLKLSSTVPEKDQQSGLAAGNSAILAGGPR